VISGKVLVLWIFLLCAGSVVGGQATSKYKPLRIPGRHTFPVSEAALLKIRDDQDVKKMREHAWELFAGLTNTRSGRPIWPTWYNKCDVGLASLGCPKLALGDTSDQHRLIQSLELSAQALLELEQSIDQVSSNALVESPKRDAQSTVLRTFLTKLIEHQEFASVWFNRPAARHISREMLNNPSVLDGIYGKRLALHSFKSEREIPPFPNRAVVLKTAWELVHLDSAYLTTPVSVWDPDRQASMQTVQDRKLSNSSDWGKRVKIDTTPGKKCADKDYDGNGGQDPVVPLDCFYAFPIDKDSPSWELINQVGAFHVPPEASGKYYLVLMAVHVITKETPDWVWATFWWHNHSSNPEYGLDRPPRQILKGNKWRHFLMNATLSRVTPSEAPPQSGGPKICFNPYLEETQANGMVSNCIQCHRRAAYSRDRDKIGQGTSLGLSWRDGTPANGIAPNPHYFDDALQTDFMWSIAIAQDTKFRDFLTQFYTQMQALPH
jgi:hypothetical protein